ncbi:hypothetical protein [Streptomyces sp. NPDC005004]
MSATFPSRRSARAADAVTALFHTSPFPHSSTLVPRHAHPTPWAIREQRSPR